MRGERAIRERRRVSAATGSLLLLPCVLMYTYGYTAAAAGAVFLPPSAIMASGNLATGSG